MAKSAPPEPVMVPAELDGAQDVLPEEQAGQARRVSWDDELLMMQRMLRELSTLDEAARGRVVAYLVSRFPFVDRQAGVRQ